MLAQTVRDIVNQPLPAGGPWPVARVMAGLGQAGLLGLSLPAPVGGGQGLAQEIPLLMALGEAAPSLEALLFITHASHRLLPLLACHGTALLREQFLVPALKGDMVGGLALTDRRSRLNPQATGLLAERAEQNGEPVWRLQGLLPAVMGADACHALLVLCRAQGPAGAPGGLSLLLVPTDLPGVTVSAPRQSDRPGAPNLCQVVFEQAAVPEHLLVGAPGGALELLLHPPPQWWLAEAFLPGVSIRLLNELTRRAGAWPVLRRRRLAYDTGRLRSEAGQARLLFEHAAAGFDSPEAQTRFIQARLAARANLRGVLRLCQRAFFPLWRFGFPWAARLLRDSRLLLDPHEDLALRELLRRQVP